MNKSLFNIDKRTYLINFGSAIALALIAKFLYLSVYGITIVKSIWMFSDKSPFLLESLAWFLPGFISALIVGFLFCFSIGYFFNTCYFSLFVFLIVLVLSISRYLSQPLHWLHVFDLSVLVFVGFALCYLGSLSQRKRRNREKKAA